MVSTAALHVRGSVPGLGGLKETKMVLPHPCVKVSIVGSPRVVVSTAAFHARVRSLVPGLGGLKETKMFLPHPRVRVSIVGSLRDREVACSPQTARARI